MKYALLDDDCEFIEHFKEITKKYLEKDELHCFSDIKVFCENMEKEQYCYVFLDIDMPSKNGIDLSKELYQKYGNKTVIIFLTNKAELVYDAFGLNVLRFIDKKEFDRKVASLFEELLKRDETEQFVSFKTQGSDMISVKIKDIVRIGKNGRRIELNYFPDQTVFLTSNQSMDDIFKKINSPMIVFINRSDIVNVNHIKIIKDSFAYMDNGLHFEISRRKRNEIKLLFEKRNYLN